MAQAGVLVVTGGSQGIGAACVRLGAQRGYAVAFSWSRSQGPADELVRVVEAAGGRVLSIQADAAEEAATVRLFEQTEAAFGPVTALVNNAGTTGPLAMLDAVTPAIIDDVMGLNVRGAFIAMREAARRMRPGGAIVNVSSRASGIGGGGEWVHYAASKAAVDTLTLGAAKELAPRGIRVNAVNPGLIDTEIHAKAGMPDRLTRMAPGVPMGRAGSAEEVAQAILFLLSTEASYITGALLPVSGGR